MCAHCNIRTPTVASPYQPSLQSLIGIEEMVPRALPIGKTRDRRRRHRSSESVRIHPRRVVTHTTLFRPRSLCKWWLRDLESRDRERRSLAVTHRARPAATIRSEPDRRRKSTTASILSALKKSFVSIWRSALCLRKIGWTRRAGMRKRADVAGKTRLHELPQFLAERRCICAPSFQATVTQRYSPPSDARHFFR